VGNGDSEAMGGQGGSRRGLGTVRAVRLMLRAHAVLFFSPNYPNRLKLENWCLTVLFFSKYLHVAGLGYCEQFSQLCQHPSPNINIAKNLDQIQHLNF
jgi:hypothetical protein